MAGAFAFAGRPQTSVKGKERVVELDDAQWEEQFKTAEAASAHDAVAAEDAELAAAAESQAFGGDFEQIWRAIHDERLETDGRASDLNDLLDFDTTYRHGRGADGQDPWDRDFEEYATSREDAGEYHFEPENRFRDAADPFAEGVRLMESGGNLSEAALAFEAACQLRPDHAEAWARLGAVQAQNEKEDPAVRALERAVQLEPTDQASLMNLAVSYINEGYENAAYAALERWLAVKYPSVVDQARAQEPHLSDVAQFQLHQRVTELFIRAAQLSPEGLSMDADVQVGLGVLFYGNDEYDKAIDCFQAALSVRPEDPLLWNRLGATYANSRRSEEAIEAYYRALNLRPSFVRARYNLGVSCINIGCYKEAAEHLLDALALHDVDRTAADSLAANQSTNLIETLRRVFLAMDRRDLAEKIEAGANPAAVRAEIAKTLLRRRKFLAVFGVFLLWLSFFTSVPFVPHMHWGSSKVVIILAVNQGGGVMQWKGPREWAVERKSIANKRAYAERHGYQLAIQDMSIKKRYAHEWRESWEKVDVIKATMKQYPKAEWFWWLDLHTFIMEPDVKIEDHVFANKDNSTYRSLAEYNPLNLPVELDHVDYSQPINLILSQDCGGFNLGSFLIRRSEWTDFLLDQWWDPVYYEQRHMDWEHKEQDALEHMYSNQAWLRSSIAFVPQRKINSFPEGACADQPPGDARFFYHEADRDFVVNMAGCEWGRDCYGEMDRFDKLSRQLQNKKSWLFF
ncbi:uncharacterized protein V1510DRAFT_425266 [Dipodascopsis tothii]|uniref:uncharacterized protein n=1 Tax=Dipodascopsis tothii TaxID=44089 RepID=UPI0034D02004